MADLWLTGASGDIGYAIKRSLPHHRIFSNSIDVRSDVTAIKSSLGKYHPSVLIYSAGVNHLAWSKEISPLEMLHLYDVNVVGFIRCFQAAQESLSRIVVIGSDAAVRPMRTSLAYNTSKAALEVAVRVIAREYAEDGLVINSVAPGLIMDTNMTQYVFDRTYELRPDLDLDKYMTDEIPMGRAGTAQEVARIVKWLIDEAPSYINGSTITMNGAR